MMRCRSIWSIFFLLLSYNSLFAADKNISINFYGYSFSTTVPASFVSSFTQTPGATSINNFFNRLQESDYTPVVNSLLAAKKSQYMNDWVYYQLIRNFVQQISPKQDNYNQYTLYKWFLLTESGYNTALTYNADKILFYVQCNENIYNVPLRLYQNQQYVCLNAHDYTALNIANETLQQLQQPFNGQLSFSYKIEKLPEFNKNSYKEKTLSFKYYYSNCQLDVKVTDELKKILNNYPVVDYATYFNMPLSSNTYQSLIPALKANIKNMSTRQGVEYLMLFTRHAFLFAPDTEVFGGEKRLTAEQTLLLDNSDCEDRSALLYFLIKEIYNLPMIVLAYPAHVTIAVQFKKPLGTTITYNGKHYTICEPTPQKKELLLGETIPVLKQSPYEIVFAYSPDKK